MEKNNNYYPSKIFLSLGLGILLSSCTIFSHQNVPNNIFSKQIPKCNSDNPISPNSGDGIDIYPSSESKIFQNIYMDFLNIYQKLNSIKSKTYTTTGTEVSITNNTVNIRLFNQNNNQVLIQQNFNQSKPIINYKNLFCYNSENQLQETNFDYYTEYVNNLLSMTYNQ